MEQNTNKRRSYRMYIRQPDLHPLQITEKCLDILEIVYNYRIVTKDIVVYLVPGYTGYIQELLKRLFHHGYLDRWVDREKIRKPGTGSEKIKYMLTNKGALILRELRGIDVPHTNFSYKNKKGGSPHKKHRLMINTFRAALLVMCAKRKGLSLSVWEERKGTGIVTNPMITLQVTANWGKGNRKLKKTPDSAFALEDEQGIYPGYLEADRSTMRWEKIVEKIICYEEWQKQGLSQEEHGFEDFRVFIITKSTQRRDSLINKLNETIQDKAFNYYIKKQRYWFASETDYSLDNPQTVFDSIWKVPGKSRQYSILDST